MESMEECFRLYSEWNDFRNEYSGVIEHFEVYTILSNASREKMLRGDLIHYKAMPSGS